MKTITNHSAANSTVRKHIFLAVTGILIAVICSLVLFQDAKASSGASHTPSVASVSKVAGAHHIGKNFLMSLTSGSALLK